MVRVGPKYRQRSVRVDLGETRPHPQSRGAGGASSHPDRPVVHGVFDDFRVLRNSQGDIIDLGRTGTVWGSPGADTRCAPAG